MLSYRQLNYYYRCYHLLVLHWMLLIVGFYLSDHTLHQKYAYSIPENNCDTHMLTQVRILRNVCVYVRPYLKQVLWTTTAMKRNTTHVFTDIQSSLFCIVIFTCQYSFSNSKQQTQQQMIRDDLRVRFMVIRERLQCKGVEQIFTKSSDAILLHQQYCDRELSIIKVLYMLTPYSLHTDCNELFSRC